MAWRRIAVGAGVGAALLVGAGALALGPAAPALVETVANGQKAWRLGRIEISNVAGASLGDLRAGRLALADGDGVWAEAEDVTLRWSPLALLGGDLRIAAVEAGSLTVLRAPTLSPSTGGGGGIDTEIGQIRVRRLALAEGVAGPAKAYAVELSLTTADEALTRLTAALAGLEGAPDRVSLDYRGGDQLVLNADIQGPEGGALADWLGAPVAARVRAAQGKGNAEIDTAGARAADLDFNWTEEAWQASGWLSLAAAPGLQALEERFGARLEFAGAVTGPPDRRQITADLTSPRVTARLEGPLDARWRIAEGLALNAEADATALGRESGRVRFAGRLTGRDSAWTAQGDLTLDRLTEADVGVSGTGPFTFRFDREEIRVRFEGADLAVTAAPLVRDLLDGADVAVDVRHDRQEGRTRLPTLSVAGRGIELTGDGTAEQLDGTWRLTRPDAVLEGAAGRLAGRWRLTTKEAVRLTLDGVGQGLKGLPDPLGAGLGPSPKIAAALSFGEAVQMERATLQGPRLRVGARGPIRDGRADIATEASWRGPLSAFGLTLAGAGDATGRVSGPLDAVTVEAEVRAASLDLAGVAVSNARATLALAPDAKGVARAGAVTLEGQLLDQPLKAQAILRTLPDGVAFDQAQASLAQASVTGVAAFNAAGPRVEATLGGRVDGLWPGAAGALAGNLDIAPGPEQEGVLTLDARLGRGALAPGIETRLVEIAATGPLDAPAFTYSVVGRTAERRFRLEGEGAARFAEGVQVEASAAGSFNGAKVAARGPLRFAMDDRGLAIEAAADVGPGGFLMSWQERDGRLRLRAEADQAPLALAGSFGRAALEGTLSGRATLEGAGDTLAGQLDLQVRGLSLARRSGDRVDADITAALAGGRITGEATARSGGGLAARITGQVPVTARAAPLAITRNVEGQGRLAWTVNGPVDGLWALFGPLDQTLTGRAQGEGAILVEGAGVRGEGALTLAGGAFEDKLSGVRIVDLEARLGFDPAGLRLERIAGGDGRGGRLEGEGALSAQGVGRLAVRLSDMRLIDRPDVNARGNGDLELSWVGRAATLTGDIRLIEAEATPLQIQAAPPPTIPVVEINRPDAVVRREEEDAAAAADDGEAPVTLDIRITADDRIFTRGRGLEAVWALDARLQGTLAEPQLFGEARLLRGAFTLAGRPFDLERGVIRFSGPIEATQIDVAAAAETQDLSAQILLTGDLSDPEVSFTSTPALPQDEVLPRILFSRSADELSPLEAAQLAASIATLSGAGAFDVAAAARSAIDLDRLDVRNEAGQLLLTGGKYLSREVYLEVARSAEGGAATSVEWQIRPRLFLISSFLPKGDQRIAVRWRREY